MVLIWWAGKSQAAKQSVLLPTAGLNGGTWSSSDFIGEEVDMNVTRHDYICGLESKSQGKNCCMTL